MTALEWTNYYNASSAPYIPPKAISDYYGGEPKYPSWSVPAVENLFVDRPSNGSSPSPAPLREGTASHLKGTIGGTVGCVGALLVSIACAIFLSLRSKRRNHREIQQATGRLPVEHKRDERQIPGGLYEADSFQPVEAGPGRPSTPELDTGQPVPQGVHAVALLSTFELENTEGDDGPDCVPTSLELGYHTNGNVSDSMRNPPELGNTLTHQEACSKDGPTGIEYLSK